MLAVTAELEDAAEAERALAARADKLWPEFVAELEEASGRAVFFAPSGALLLAADGAELEMMRARARHPLRIVGPDEARRHVPLLGRTVGGLWSPHEAHVDNRALGEALAIAFLKAGGVLNPNEAAVRIAEHDGRAVAVQSPYRHYPADMVLVAAGAWSGLLEQIPIEPVKGEMIALSPPEGVALPGPVVWGEHVYCVPRHGRMLVGATVQEEGFDTSPTQAACDELWARAARLMPALRGWSLDEHWAGLRPKSPDGLPLLGPTRVPNLFVAGGQYRNGILFTPAIAREMADIMLGKGRVVPDFDPRRFTEGTP
jgi:glycine oxidase